ncbi:cation:proton antiporter [Thermogymnomonas acidicola]|nr:sodium:proton antiporter [Thermogymnomonas acidicola]
MLSSFASQYYQISLVLILAAFSIPISRKIAVADIPILILMGLIFGPFLGIIHHSFAIYFMTEFGSVGIGILGIVIILYYESHNINFRVIRRHFWNIVSLDTLGLVVTALVGGAIFSLMFRAPFSIGFMFGAIISPTDPATLIPLFKRIRIKEDVSGTLVGESIFNDPLSIILFTIAVAMVAPTSSYVSFFTSISSRVGIPLASVIYLLIQITVPSIIGIVVGFSVLYLNRLLNFENLLVALLLGTVLLEFTVLEASGITPFPAIIATGAIVGNFSDKSIFWNRESNFQENLSFLAQAVIFILLGSVVTRADLRAYIPYGIAISLAVMLVVRPISVYVSTLPTRAKWMPRRIDRKVVTFMSLVGPRGVVSVVLSTLPYAIGLVDANPLLLKWGPLISVMTAFVVLISIVVQTVYVPVISHRLFGMAEAKPGDKSEE